MSGHADLPDDALAARLDGLADLTQWSMSPDAWNDGPNGARTLLREAASRLREHRAEADAAFHADEHFYHYIPEPACPLCQDKVPHDV